MVEEPVLLETFVVGQLVTHSSWTEDTSTTGQWRTRDGDEVDLAIERDDGTILAADQLWVGSS